ncbi:MAG: 50S ribosomal protein L23 [Proteobacteria bacterium]|nr:50S ribosomal protein L23 [Pseudomonadota bacterium]
MDSLHVLKKAVMSEKATSNRESLNKYTFVVDSSASKNQIKDALFKMYGVKGLKVRTMIVRGKIKRKGIHETKTSNFKKAFVSLPDGVKLPLFEE